LIVSLKAEIASQSSLAKESRGLKRKVESQIEEMATLKAQVAQLKASLDEAHSQNKTLSTKLAANRGATASLDNANSKVPGSNGGVNAGQAAQLKEDLYSDLTGLIIRGVKREAEDDTFDCIQTGRNGSKFPRMSYSH
jgi:chromosome segregation ATPase